MGLYDVGTGVPDPGMGGVTPAAAPFPLLLPRVFMGMVPSKKGSWPRAVAVAQKVPPGGIPRPPYGLLAYAWGLTSPPDLETGVVMNVLLPPPHRQLHNV